MFNLNWYAINPQPLPPRLPTLYTNPSVFTMVALNPQPLPPLPPDLLGGIIFVGG